MKNITPFNPAENEPTLSVLPQMAGDQKESHEPKAEDLRASAKVTGQQPKDNHSPERVPTTNGVVSTGVAAATPPKPARLKGSGRPATLENIFAVSTSADGEPIVQTVLLSQLSTHPRQIEIYGEVPQDDPIFESVHSDGVIHPLTVNERGVILSGNRRAAAAKTEGKTQVRVIVVPNRTEAEELEFLIKSNLNRVKSPEQMAREAATLMKIEAAKAALRQADAGRAKKGKTGKEVPVKSPEAKVHGDARDIVGKKLGMGGTKAAQCERVIDKLDELRAQGKNDKADELLGYLTKSVSKAAGKLVLFSVDPKPDDKASEEVVTPTQPTKAEILTEVWMSLSKEMTKWTPEKISSFKTAVLDFRKTWEAGYAPEKQKEVV